ncbi:phosphatidylserine/phosphatidylglycerophosphate/cardiolipin synthase family protein [Hoylesella saccharolytica]|uniref:phospholipase D-like domain-containing protein n=1 Tax=Hoylesella saccharolytica TaxID=633701 RepID=UPI0028F03D10|nr:phosphatidylserine/phosphatidylglycerophosphate/cardiolipin synthase family protein [Hoylesella saccharolytica]
MGKPVIATSTKSKLGATVSMNWFLDSEESAPVGATFRPLINGKEAFTTLHEKIEKAEHSIDIAIWGFQPSMHLKRDGKSKCIGDLLIEKAKAGVQVRILVWSIPFKIQTFSEANMGNAPGVFSGGVAGVTKAQKQYDRNWYLAREGKLHTLYPHASQNIQKSYPQLWELSKSSYQKNLKFKTRSVESQSNQYEDKELPGDVKVTLKIFPSHHQKTVLIDYEVPHKAVGFVMEHNMLDNYWDDDSHISGKVSAPNQGKNVDTPLQDVSSIVSGEVLWYINRNFCQSWDKESSEKLGEKRKALTFDKYPFNKSAGGTPLMAQILRTYDNPDIEDIKKIYLQNIKRVTSYIYTENQFFRWPPLAEEFIKYWQNVRSKRRANMPIHWFVVTNSSNDGLGKGTYTTNKMLEKLGRQDVMPNVALTDDNGRRDALNTTLMHTPRGVPGETVNKWKKERDDLQARFNSREGMKERPYTKNAEEVREKEFVKKLKKELGVKVHVCTLTASNAWKEVYIHSKVTIIDDVFTVISSANLNTRSMQVDTELGIFTENGAVARKLRKDLWKLHTRDLHKANNAAGKFDNAANPEEMNDPSVAIMAFKRWQTIMDENKKQIINGKPPLHPLCEFLRLDPKVSRLD